jgi:4'-phosphopantetheinyl transferase
VPLSPAHADLGKGARLWIVRLDRMPADRALLDDHERERLERLGESRRASRYAARRTALRLVLGSVLELAPSRVPLVSGAQGKPVLTGHEGIAFNLAHRGDTAVIAVAQAGAIGADLESMRPSASPGRLAGRFFHEQENATIAALPPRLLDAAFLRCWTAKEAVLKAIGSGLSEPMRNVVVSADPREPLRLLALPGKLRVADWTLHELALARGRLALAVAVPAPDTRIAGVHVLPIGERGARGRDRVGVEGAPQRGALASLAAGA